MASKKHSIAISGQCSTGKSTLGKLLAKKLRWKYFDVGGEYKKIVQKLNLRIENFGDIPEKQLTQIDDNIKERMRKEYNVIWDSRLSGYLAQDNTAIFKIYCKADLLVRAQRTAQREGILVEKAKQQIIDRDKEEKRVFKKLYNISNIYNKKWIDLCIDTSRKSPAELVDDIFSNSYLL